VTKEELNRRFDEMKKPTVAAAERMIFLFEDIPGKAWAVKMASVWRDDGTPEPGMTMVLKTFDRREWAESYLRYARHILEFALRCARGRTKGS
jgi:hypothetical protein